MRKTIEEIWNGNIEPINELGKHNKDIKKVLQLIELNQQKIEKLIGNGNKLLLEKYRDCFDEYIMLLTEQAFCDGFCLAVKIMSEAMIN